MTSLLSRGVSDEAYVPDLALSRHVSPPLAGFWDAPRVRCTAFLSEFVVTYALD